MTSYVALVVRRESPPRRHSADGIARRTLLVIVFERGLLQQPSSPDSNVTMSMGQAQLFQRQPLRFAQRQQAFHQYAAPYLICIPND